MANRYYLQRELRKEHEKLNCLYQKAKKKDTSLYTNELIQKNKKVSDLILKQKENDST